MAAVCRVEAVVAEFGGVRGEDDLNNIVDHLVEERLLERMVG